MDKIIKKLKYYDKKFPFNELQEAIDKKDEITPILLETLDEVIEKPEIILDDINYMLHEYSIYLLAQFREKRAFAKIIKLVSMDEEDVEEMLDDIITESLSSILYSTYDGQLELIQSVIENTSIHFYVRSVLLDLYVKLYNENFITKESVIEYFEKIIYEIPFDEENDLACDIAIAVSDAHIFEMIQDIEYLYDEERIDTTVIGEYDSFIDMIYDYDFDYGHVHYIDDVIGEMSWWSCFEQSKEKKKEDEFETRKLKKELDLLKNLKSKIDKNIKIGRNDPCPCGSGKKYKKCCMNKSEEDNLILFEDKGKWLSDYPEEPTVKTDGRVYLSENFEKESIELDKLVYLALHHRPIPIYVKRDKKKEDRIKLMYLTEASRLFYKKCEKENISSFENYDIRYKIHYNSELWFEELSYLLSVQEEKEKYENDLSVVEELLARF